MHTAQLRPIPVVEGQFRKYGKGDMVVHKRHLNLYYDEKNDILYEGDAETVLVNPHEVDVFAVNPADTALLRSKGIR